MTRNRTRLMLSGLLTISACQFLLTGHVFAQTIPVFTSGQDGYKTYRIPAIVQAPNGDLLAFCEGRVNGGADFGHVDIVMKRSRDEGRTWGPLQVVATNNNLQAGNPAPLVDMMDPDNPHGRIFLFYCTGDNTEGEVRKGNGLREVWFKTSIDNGRTWREGTNITTQVHRPFQPGKDPLYRFKEDWRSYATTPGHALQLIRGAARGRIFVPINHSQGPPQPGFLDYQAGGFFSDDHGRSFRNSEDIRIPGSNESMAVELSDGSLMLNARDQSGRSKARIVAISRSGGASWDTAFIDKALPDPVCQGSILELSGEKGRHTIAFCNDNDTANRNNLTLRISQDGGRTWTKGLLIEGAPNPSAETDKTAYSDMVALPRHKIGILYERDDYREIVFVTKHW